MRIALIADIHSNFDYLTEVHLEIKKLGIDQIFCLGDLVGYYDSPNEVIQFMIDNKIECVKGNHEKYLLEEEAYDKSKEEIYRFTAQRSIISDDNMRYLRALPDKIEKTFSGANMLMVHSKPGDALTGFKHPSELDEYDLGGYQYYCSGHTHIPMVIGWSNMIVLNPGSVGQPRDYSQTPSFIIIDFTTNTCTLHKVKVDVKAYVNKLRGLNFNPDLINILER